MVSSFHFMKTSLDRRRHDLSLGFRDAKIDALLISSPANWYYLTGFTVWDVGTRKPLPPPLPAHATTYTALVSCLSTFSGPVIMEYNFGGRLIPCLPECLDFKAGKAAALNFLKGQVMKLSRGKANPALVGEILERKLKA